MAELESSTSDIVGPSLLLLPKSLEMPPGFDLFPEGWDPTDLSTVSEAAQTENLPPPKKRKLPVAKRSRSTEAASRGV